MTGERRPVARWGLRMLLVGIVVAVSLGPVPQPNLPGVLEQSPHVVAYAALTLGLLEFTGRDPGRGSTWKGILLLSSSVIALGIALELAQLVVDREVGLADVVANVLGVAIVLGWIAARAWLSRRTPHGGEA